MKHILYRTLAIICWFWFGYYLSANFITGHPKENKELFLGVSFVLGLLFSYLDFKEFLKKWQE